MSGKILLVLLLSVAGQVLSSLPSDPTYNAGVVEFQPSRASTGKQKAKENMDRMKEVIESDETKNLDILVFPEFVLNNIDMMTFVPDPKDLISPCVIPDYDYFLSELSCSARSRQLYVVINVVEKARCDQNSTVCPDTGYNVYNTNVVFDRQGRVISRYRKTHLYRYEWYTENVLAQPEMGIFHTDFGVTFGHFICFDMLFYDTAQALVDKMNITDIIYPTYWFSELPFLTAVQLQEGWAYANDVNLLAADASYPAGQNTGSGIYAGRLGRLTAVIHEEPKTVVLKAAVPKRGHAVQVPPTVVQFAPELQTKRFTKMDLLRDYNVDIFATHLLGENFETASHTLCHKGFCCQFHVQRKPFLPIPTGQLTSYRYRLVAYNGSETTHQRMDRSEIAVCAVVACTDAEVYSCGHIFPDGVTVSNKYYFESIFVEASLRTAEKRLIMPTSVDGLMMPLPVGSYTFKEVEGTNSTNVSIEMNFPKNDLLTFGFWANYYSPEKTKHNLNHYWYPTEQMTNNGVEISASFTVLVVGIAVVIMNLW